MKAQKMEESKNKKIMLDILKSAFFGVIAGIVLLVCLSPLISILNEKDDVAKVALEYVENLEDEKVGKVSKAYPNISTGSKLDFFALAENGKTYFVDLDNKRSKLIFTYELIEFNENNSKLNKMLEKSIARHEK